MHNVYIQVNKVKYILVCKHITKYQLLILNKRVHYETFACLRVYTNIFYYLIYEIMVPL